MGLGAIGLQDRVATAAQPVEQDVGVCPVGFNIEDVPLLEEHMAQLQAIGHLPVGHRHIRGTRVLEPCE